MEMDFTRYPMTILAAAVDSKNPSMFEEVLECLQPTLWPEEVLVYYSAKPLIYFWGCR